MRILNEIVHWPIVFIDGGRLSPLARPDLVDPCSE